MSTTRAGSLGRAASEVSTVIGVAVPPGGKADSRACVGDGETLLCVGAHAVTKAIAMPTAVMACFIR
jgi:hypothetical protein